MPLTRLVVTLKPVYRVNEGLRLLSRPLAMGEAVAQSEAIDRRRPPRSEQRQVIPSQRDLLHVGLAVGTGGQVQLDADFGQNRQMVVKVLGCAVSDITAGCPLAVTRLEKAYIVADGLADEQPAAKVVGANSLKIGEPAGTRNPSLTPFSSIA